MLRIDRSKPTTETVVHDGNNPVVHSQLDKGLRLDGWQNVFTGMGIANRDKGYSTTFNRSARLDENTLTYLYRGDGFARRIIDLAANDMVREWFHIEGDPDGTILKKLQTIKTKKSVKRLIKWARLFGGSLGVIGIDDGQGDLEKPVNEARVKDIHFIHPYDRHRVWWSTQDLYQDPEHPKFGTPEVYTIFPVNSVTMPFRVHETRTIRFDGADIPERSRHENNGWFDSELQYVYDRLKDMGQIYGGVVNIVDEFVISTLSIENLQDMIANGQEDLIKTRLNLIDMSKHLLNTVLLDKEEAFEKKSSSTQGLSLIIDKYTEALSAVTGYPVTLLMGQSPKGLQATGDADIRFYYDKIASMQEENLLDPIDYLVKLCTLASDVDTGGLKDEGLNVVFNSLWQPTEDEISEQRKKTAETDQIYIDTGVLMPEEVALSRFGGETYSMDTVLMTGDRTSLAPDPEDEDEEGLDNPEDEPGDEE